MKKRKKILETLKKKKWITMLTAFILVVGIGVGIFLFSRVNDPIVVARSMEAQSATVSKGSITTTVIGTGNLETADAENVLIPEGIEIEKILVQSGTHVEKGTVLATLEEASVTRQMLAVQEEITELDEEINEVKDDTESENITTKIGGRIKKIYAEEGVSVKDTMVKNGALLLLSIDGKMSVELDDVPSLSVGDTVEVILSDGSTTKEGTVAEQKAGTCVITLTDNGTELGESVTVKNADETVLGSGTLSIHQALEITGVSGTVDEIAVTENESVSAEETLLTLTEVSGSAKYQELVAKREKLAAQLMVLLELSETNTLTADFSGTVQSIYVSEGSAAGDSTSGSGTGTGTVIGTSTGSSAGFAKTGGTTGKSIFTYVSASTGTEKKDTAEHETNSNTMIHSIVNIVSAPVAGADAQTSIHTQQCTGSISWESEGGAFSGKFQSASVYTAKVVLTAADGYEFAAAGDLSVAQDRSEKTEWNTEAKTATLIFVFLPTDITSCALNIAVPQKGTVPQTAVNATSLYSGNISWSPETAVFESDSQYIATVTLTAQSGYQFASAGGMQVTLNGTAVSQVSVNGDRSTLTLSLVYTVGKDGISGTPETGGQNGENSTDNNSGNDDSKKTNGTTNSDNNSNNNPSGNESGTQSNGASNGTASLTPSAGSSSSGGGTSAGGAAASSSSGSTGTDGSSTGSSDATDTSNVEAFTISPEETAVLSVNVDELDILSIGLGQEAEITFDAIEGETFSGEITNISDTASVSGGVAKYSVAITLSKSESMKTGMNATAVITIEDKQDILLIPVSALQERGTSTFVYTEQDGESGTLSGEVEVETGLSDGSNVEIISGLSEGDAVYYSRSAVTENSSEKGMMNERMGGMGDRMGGDMPSGGGQPPANMSGGKPSGGWGGQ